MYTLSIFPELLTFWLIAPFLLRLAVGFIFIHSGYKKIKNRKQPISLFDKISFKNKIIFFWTISLIEIAGGIFLVIGLFTQVVAIILSIITIGAMCIKIKKPNLLKNSLEFYILLFIILLSLLFLGAGFWAIDLPI